MTLKSMLAAGGLLISGLFLMPHSLNGQEVAGAPENYQTRPSPHFKPNKGQVADHEGNLIKGYEYVYQAPGMKMGLKKNGFSYNLYTVEEKAKPDKKVSEATGKPANAEQRPERPGNEEAKKQRTYHYHRVEVEFMGANEDPEIIAEEKMDYYANYYLGYLPEHVTKVHGYQKLTYKNLYDSIDLVLTRKKGKNGQERLKYDIVVHPGGDLSDVKMVYKGMNDLSAKDGKLQITTSQGKMTETIPASYWAESQEDVAVGYEVDENVVSFKARQDQNGQTLVVDPSLNWSTFIGGNNWDNAREIATDNNGNVFVTGQTESANFPTTNGAYQTSFGGGGGIGDPEDAFLCKFSSSGSLQWSTFIGGSNNEAAFGIAVDNNGNAFVGGFTQGSNFPVTTGAYQVSYSGGNEGFLSKFTGSGILNWSTFFGGNGKFGGNGNEIFTDLTTDNSGNVIGTGWTGSSNFPTTAGAYQTTYGGGVNDAFLTKFTGSGNLSWSTYLGSSDYERSGGVATDVNGNVFVTGWSRSNNFPTTNGAYQTTYGGGGDAFLCKFTGSGSLSWSTYIGGSGNEPDVGFYDYGDIATDGIGNVYLTGKTSSSNFPTTNGAYQTTYGGGGDAFLSKFSGSGTLIWSTFLGGSDFDIARDVTTDNKGNAFVTGDVSGNGNNFPTTMGAYQTSGGGVYLSKFTSGGCLSYSSFLGDGFFSAVATDNSGNALISGSTSSSNFPTTSGAYQTKLSGSNDAFITKFDFSNNFKISIKPGFLSDSACLKDSLKFIDTTTIECYDTITKYDWHFGDGDSASGKSVKHTYDTAGNYAVELIVTTANGNKDTATRNSKVYPKPKADFTVNDTGQCKQGNSYQFTDQSSISSGNLNYDWDFGDGSSATKASPTHSYNSYGNYNSELIVTSGKGCKDTANETMDVHPMPEPAFSYTEDSSQCLAGNQYSLTNNSTIAKDSQTYSWDFGDNTTSTKQAPTHSYNSPGTYTIELVATSDSGCKDTTTRKVKVEPMPTADFTVNDTGQCKQGNSYQFTDQSSISSGSLNYEWDFGDGDTSDQQSPTHSYSSYGNYNTELIVTSGKGCKDTANETMDVHPMPQPAFSYSEDSSQCLVGNQYSLSNNSTIAKGSQSYNWDFGDNTTSTKQAPTHSYNSPGTYTIELVATSDSGCKDTTTRKVTVEPMPTADFTVNDTGQCQQGNSYQFTDQSSISSGSLNYDWDFGDGSSATTASPTHSYGSYGNYNSELIVTSGKGCKDTANETMDVHPMPQPAFSYTEDSSQCLAGNQYSLSNNSTIAKGSQTYSWDFGDNTTSTKQAPTHSYNSPGTYTIELIATSDSGCKDTTTRKVTVEPMPTANFTVNDTGQCKQGNSYQFTDQSSISSGSLNYDWDFGDGSSATTASPTHTYSSYGNYNSELIVTSGKGCTDTANETMDVHPMPQPAFGYSEDSSQCLAGNQYSLINNSTIAKGSQSYSWDFGDNTTSTKQAPTHSYNSPGTYTIKLIATSDSGCKDTTTRKVTVEPIPTADFTVNDTGQCKQGNSYRFTDQSSISAGSLNYDWDFGDGSSVTTASPTHSYSSYGNYSTELIVTSGKGCKDTANETMDVHPMPEPAFSYTEDSSQCLAGNQYSLNNNSSIAKGSQTYSWDFGDGSTSTKQAPKHSYSSPGTYTIELVATSDSGCVDTTTRKVTVEPMPAADFTVNDTGQCKQGNSYQFTDQSSISSGNLNYDWDFGDGSSAPTASPTHSYSSYGNYNSELTVTSGKGCKDTANETMDVHPMPQPAFSYTEDSSQCLAGNQYSLNNNSSIAKGSQSYSWDFGDNTTSTNKATTHSYSSPGTYTIELVATSDSGCVDTITRKVTVEPMPTADFTVNDTGQCKQGNSYQFTDQSSISSGTLNYDWDFGDGSSATTASPTHSYSSYGNYNSKLTVTSGKGCKDTANETMDVHPMPKPAFSYTQDSSQCLAGNQYSLTNNSTIAKGSQSYSWDFGDNTTSTKQAPTHSYSSPGTYTLELIATSDSGCVDTTTRKVTVEPMPTADFTVNDTGQCKQGNSYQFTDQSSISAGTLNYDWDFGDGSSATTASPNHSYSSYGNYNSKLIVTSGKGCTDTANETMDVHPMPSPAFSYTQDSSQCLAGNQYSLNNNSTIAKGSQSYSWDFGDNSTSTKQAPTHSYSSPGTYTIELVATSDSGCKDTTTRKVTVEPMPTADFTVNDTGQCKQGNSYQFTDQSSISSGSLNYDWDFGDGDTSDQQSPTHSYGSYGNYNTEVIVTSGKGCQDTADETMDVHPMPTADFTVNDTGQCLEGNSYQFTNESDISEGSLTYDWAFGDGDTSDQSSTVHSYDNNGIYQATLVVASGKGCQDTASEQMTAHPMPTPAFVYPEDSLQCLEGNMYSFDNQSSIASGTQSYQWELGDDSTTTATSPDQSYESTGNYEVQLIATSDQGCQDTAIRKVAVAPMPSIGFTYNKLDYETVAFEANDTTLPNYRWAFGDQDSASVPDPKHVYENNGAFVVSLVATNKFGCPDTSWNTVTMTNVGLDRASGESAVSLKAYPNPFSNDLSISYKLPSAKDQVRLAVVDQKGRLIVKQDLGSQNSGKYTKGLDAMKGAPAGTYYIRLIINDKQQVERVVKVE